MMEIAVLENLQREDLTPLDEAQAYDTLIKRLSLTQAEVSKRLGKSRPYIANYLRLLTLPNEVKKMLNQNKLSMGQARTLLSLKDKKRLIPLAKKTVSDNLTVRQLERLINQMNAGSRKRNQSPSRRFSRPAKISCKIALAPKSASPKASKVKAKSRLISPLPTTLTGYWPCWMSISTEEALRCTSCMTAF